MGLRLDAFLDGVAVGSWPLEGELTLQIGRSADAQVRLNDGRVARRHAILEMHAGTLTLTDQRVGAGTFVNGKLITRATLKPNDVIYIGLFRLVVSA
jgi:pSer/pThr/pTyr-binding forkhead associated (FHA) protein